MSQSFSRTTRNDERDRDRKQRERDQQDTSIPHTAQQRLYHIHKTEQRKSHSQSQHLPNNLFVSHQNSRQPPTKPITTASPTTVPPPPAQANYQLQKRERSHGIIPIPNPTQERARMRCTTMPCQTPPTHPRTNTPPTKPDTKEGRQTNKPTSSTHQHPPPQTPPAASDPPWPRPSHLHPAPQS